MSLYPRFFFRYAQPIYVSFLPDFFFQYFILLNCWLDLYQIRSFSLLFLLCHLFPCPSSNVCSKFILLIWYLRTNIFLGKNIWNGCWTVMLRMVDFLKDISRVLIDSLIVRFGDLDQESRHLTKYLLFHLCRLIFQQFNLVDLIQVTIELYLLLSSFPLFLKPP